MAGKTLEISRGYGSLSYFPSIDVGSGASEASGKGFRVLTLGREVDLSQAWFWTPEWQAREAEANADIQAGRFDRYLSGEDFLDSLR